MITCPKCRSPRTRKLGVFNYKKKPSRQRRLCNGCSAYFYTSVEQAVSKTPKAKTWLITSAVSDIPVNAPTLATMLGYCKHTGAEFLVVPIKYKLHGLAESDKEYKWAVEVQEYLVWKNTRLLDKLVLMAGINMNPAIAYPLSSMEALSKGGDNLIFAATQLAMKTVATSHTGLAAIITTTGTVTEPVYTATKAGCRAEFNHSYSAVIIEQDLEIEDFHYRVLHVDDDGVAYDLDKRYKGGEISESLTLPALVTGDTHAIFADPDVTVATYSATDSIANVLNPEQVVLHDILDAWSISHHHKSDIFTQYGKYVSGTNRIEAELHLTMKYIKDNVPEGSQAVVVASNHDSHLTKFLNTADIKQEPWNAEIFHRLSYLMLRRARMGKSGVEYPDAFSLWAGDEYPTSGVKFLSGFDSHAVEGIELAAHGDKGSNGSRGSISQSSRLGVKTISGHSHSPGIMGGAMAVGHSCYSRLSYNTGSSSWRQAHAVIYPNGKRNLIFITKGKWRR